MKRRNAGTAVLVAAGIASLALAGCTAVSDQAASSSSSPTPGPSQVVLSGNDWVITLCDPLPAPTACTTTQNSMSGAYKIPIQESLPPFLATSTAGQFDLTNTDLGCYSFLGGLFAIDPNLGFGIKWPYLAGDTSSSDEVEMDVDGDVELWFDSAPSAGCKSEVTSAQGPTKQQIRELHKQLKNAPSTQPSQQQLTDTPSEQECEASSACTQVDFTFPVMQAGTNGPSPLAINFDSQIIELEPTGHAFIDNFLSLPRPLKLEIDATLTAS